MREKKRKGKKKKTRVAGNFFPLLLEKMDNFTKAFLRQRLFFFNAAFFLGGGKVPERGSYVPNLTFSKHKTLNNHTCYLRNEL